MPNTIVSSETFQYGKDTRKRVLELTCPIKLVDKVKRDEVTATPLPLIHSDSKNCDFRIEHTDGGHLVGLHLGGENAWDNDRQSAKRLTFVYLTRVRLSRSLKWMARFLRSLFAVSLAAIPALAQTVTATAKVRIDGKLETVRKINNRWWSEDNRQLTPAKDGFIWWIGTEKGKGWNFHHHRPVDLHSVESLRLWMSPDSVRNLLGGPNEETGRDDLGSHLWMYYAQDGAAIFIRFTHDELIEATYQGAAYPLAGKPVQSIAQELNGRTSFQAAADRAWQRNDPDAYAKYHPQSAHAPIAQHGAPASVQLPAYRPPAPKPPVAAEKAAQVKAGMTRDELTRLLGDPPASMRMSGGDTDIEDITYNIEPSGQIKLHFEDGRITRVDR